MAKRKFALTMANDNFAGLIFLLPFAVLFLIFKTYPILAGVYISLFKRDILGLENEFIGLGNYISLLQDDVFWLSLWNTLRYTMLSTPTMVPLSLLLALSIKHVWKGGTYFRLLFFLPNILSVAVISLIWRWVYQPEWGLLNHYLSMARFPEQNWLSDPVWAMFAIVVVDNWWRNGFKVIIFLAGLGQISPELYEASKVDGASAWHSFWHVTLPGIRPSLLFVLATHLIGSLQIFGMIFIMTRGGPYGSTRVLVQYIYENGFNYYKMGYASALAYILMIVILAFTFIQFGLMRSKE
jgi:multiple sugar transport system permease protein